MVDEDGVLYITPSGGDKAIVPPSDIAVYNPNMDLFEGPRWPSIETPMHVEIYKSKPSCRAVLHAHSMALIAFSLVREMGSIASRACHSYSDAADCHPGAPDTRCLLSAWSACGRVAFVPYYPPGSGNLAEACANALTNAHCAILQNHGVVTTGKTLQEAFGRFVTLEYLAQTIINASTLGIPVPLKEKVLHFTMEQKIQGGGHPLSRRQRGGYLRPISRCCSSQCCCKNRLIRGEEKECRSELCTFVQRAYDHKLFTSSSGSMSIRVRKDASEETNEHVAFVISPTNIDRESLGVADICYVSNDPTECVNEDRHSKNREASVTGSKMMTSTSASTLRDPTFYPLSSRPTIHPSHTAEIHHTIYAMNPQINCVIVAQPQYTTAFCITGRPFNSSGIPESHLVMGNVPSLPFESITNSGHAIAQIFAGSTSTAVSCAPVSMDEGDGACNTASGNNSITSVLVNGFGLVSAGSSPIETFVQVEVCESSCGVLLTALRRGNPLLLNETQVQEIDDIFGSGDGSDVGSGVGSGVGSDSGDNLLSH